MRPAIFRVLTKNGRDPGVVLADEPVIANDSVHGAVSQRRLVDELKRVGDTQERQNVSVNLLPDLFGHFGIDSAGGQSLDGEISSLIFDVDLGEIDILLGRGGRTDAVLGCLLLGIHDGQFSFSSRRPYEPMLTQRSQNSAKLPRKRPRNTSQLRARLKFLSKYLYHNQPTN